MLDIRTYRTVPGGRDELVRIMAEEAVPRSRRRARWVTDAQQAPWGTMMNEPTAPPL